MTASPFARRKGSTESALTAGTTNTDGVARLIVSDGGTDAELHVAGEFPCNGGVTARKTASWDRSLWRKLCSGISANVRALAVHDDGAGQKPYAAAPFAGGGSAISDWNGGTWADAAPLLAANALALAVRDEGTG